PGQPAREHEAVHDSRGRRRHVRSDVEPAASARHHLRGGDVPRLGGRAAVHPRRGRRVLLRPAKAQPCPAIAAGAEWFPCAGARRPDDLVRCGPFGTRLRRRLRRDPFRRNCKPSPRPRLYYVVRPRRGMP
ncbi:MAG: hypothetical protein LUQ37_05345, partial [Methanoregulaceae archaeon]|nr:hypothetical protein [Methanoregulaceae archaeon]